MRNTLLRWSTRNTESWSISWTRRLLRNYRDQLLFHPLHSPCPGYIYRNLLHGHIGSLFGTVVFKCCSYLVLLTAQKMLYQWQSVPVATVPAFFLLYYSQNTSKVIPSSVADNFALLYLYNSKSTMTNNNNMPRYTFKNYIPSEEHVSVSSPLKRVVNNKFYRIVFGVMIGALLGFLYWRFVGCNSGTCAITSNPYKTVILFSIMGGLLSNR